MLVAPIEGVAYNSQSCQIMFSKYLRSKTEGFVTIKIELNQVNNIWIKSSIN